MTPVYEKIRQKRIELGISQYELAIRTEILNQSQISKIEAGNRILKVRDLMVLAKALKVPVNELTEEIDIEKEKEDT